MRLDLIKPDDQKRQIIQNKNIAFIMQKITRHVSFVGLIVPLVCMMISFITLVVLAFYQQIFAQVAIIVLSILIFELIFVHKCS